MRSVGQRLPRVDGREKVTGAVQYTEDLRLPGLLHARLLLSPHAHARIVRLDVGAARRVPGVVAVLTARDVPQAPDADTEEHILLADGEVRFVGHPVAAVLAESEAAAADGVEALAQAVHYAPLPAVLDPEAALRPDAPVVRPEGVGEDAEAGAHAAVETRQVAEARPPNAANVVRLTRGDVEAGFREAEVVVAETFTTSRVYQAYLEPQAVVAVPDLLHGGVTLHTATQGIFNVRERVADLLGLPAQRVRVVPMPVGGGFGGKILLIQGLAAQLALAVRRPVRLVLTRREDFLIACVAPASRITARLGARRDGTLVALEARLLFECGAAPGSTAGIAATLFGGYYRVPHLRLEGYDVLTHRAPTGAYRAPGAPQATFAIEGLMDRLAAALGRDPLELRLQNAAAGGDPMPSGRPWRPMGLRAVLQRLATHPLWRARQPGQGIGVAVGGWTGGVESAAANVKANPDGTFDVIVGAVDLTGTFTGLAQIAATVLNVPVEAVRVVGGDTDQAPYAGMSAGSKTLYTVGQAVRLAAEDARTQILAIAAKELEAQVDDLEIADGQVQVRGAPARGIALAEVAQRSMRFGAKYPPIFGRGACASPRQSPGFAGHLVQVEVDRETGEVRVRRHVVVQDVGFAVNPAAVEGQVFGGAAQAVGWGLFERLAYDETGQLLTATFADYALPRAHRLAPLEAMLVEEASEEGPFGAKGVGEPPVVAGAAAIASAIADATGVWVRDLPITPARLLAALREREAPVRR
jgi:CO/xanthine dehydrogenase Mo-binding subunit